MKKIGGIAVIAAFVLAGCSAPVAESQRKVQPVVQVKPALVQGDMLTELRPLLTTLKASDAELLSEAYGACANLLFRDKDAYREAVLRDYPDVALALDHLTVAAAGKKYLCP